MRKLNSIAPARHVVHPFALINLVNKFGRVIHKSHGSFARHPGASQPIYESDPQAMEAKTISPPWPI